MKKFAVIALSLSLVSTAASAGGIEVTTTVDGAPNTRRIDCGRESDLASSALSQKDKDTCAAFFQTAGGAGAGAGAGAFGLGTGATLALAALGIALVAGFGGSSNTTTN